MKNSKCPRYSENQEKTQQDNYQEPQHESQQLVIQEELSDRQIHKEKFSHSINSKYLTKQTTSCATSLKSGKLLFDIISNNKSPQIEQPSKPQLAKLKSKIKIRNFCLNHTQQFKAKKLRQVKER